jgi:hypothetical protein
MSLSVGGVSGRGYCCVIFADLCSLSRSDDAFLLLSCVPDGRAAFLWDSIISFYFFFLSYFLSPFFPVLIYFIPFFYFLPLSFRSFSLICVYHCFFLISSYFTCSFAVLFLVPFV